ncbi:hypothetical protein AAVH_23118 [Aphelenchoides avenae]|nr:hypothetical protein AAVH_23118 [Aphelenchus avenae]
MESDDDTEYFKLTEEGILGYCFTLDDGLPVPKARILRITWPTITPAFFKKVVEASKASQLTCDVELSLGNVRFDVGNLGIGVPPTSYEEYDEYFETYERNVRYNIADHGNGIRLLIHFKSGDGEEWEVIVRHGKKEHEEFFEPAPEEEDPWSPSTEYLEHEPELEGPDEWY